MDINKIKPYQRNVLLRIEHGPTKSRGGLIIPEAEKRRSPLGTIIRTGEGVTKATEGMLTYFDLYEGSRVDETHIIISEDFLYADIERDKGGK